MLRLVLEVETIRRVATVAPGDRQEFAVRRERPEAALALDGELFLAAIGRCRANLAAATDGNALAGRHSHDTHPPAEKGASIGSEGDHLAAQVEFADLLAGMRIPQAHLIGVPGADEEPGNHRR